jgi:hypothetical protein
MKQKYNIFLNDEKGELSIKESAELDKELFSVLCEETYKSDSVESAIGKGKEALISTLRTNNFYPIGVYADKIADSVMDLYRSDTDRSIELLFDDKELLAREREALEAQEEIEGDVENASNEIDELLQDDVVIPKGEGSKSAAKKQSLKIEDDT